MALLRFASGLDPVSALMTLQRELDRVFENPLGFDLGPSARGVYPPVNVFSNKDHCLVRMEVPGVAPDRINIESEGRTLTISGERELEVVEGGSHHRRERDSGKFSRSLQLPADLDLGRAQASCKNGLLTIRIPMREETKPRQIPVKAA